MNDENKNKDVAGPIMGWSLNNGIAKDSKLPSGHKNLDELMEFPAHYTFKIIVLKETGIVKAIKELIEQTISTSIPKNKISGKDSKNAKYHSITVKIRVQSSAEVYAVYAALNADSRVKYLL